VVLICNAPEGQVVHYLIGSFGKRTGSHVKVRAKVPPHVNHLIVYTQYPDLAARDWFESSDRVIFLSDWSEVLKLLKLSHGLGTRLAVYPSADIQYSP